MKKVCILVVIAAMFSMLSTGVAGPIRPLFSKENRTPELYKLEIGSLFSYTEIDEPGSLQRNDGTISPYFRFGLLENLTLYSSFPYTFIDSDLIGKRNGIEDIAAGLELLAYEYTYEYPYVIPYVEVSFPTGNEDKGLGAGDYNGTFGTSIGTTVADIYQYILDGRYEYSQIGNRSEGLFAVAVAFIWNLSNRFSVLAEAKITEKPSGSNKNIPAYFNGGMCYEATESLSIYWYGGTSANTDEDGSGAVKIAYSF